MKKFTKVVSLMLAAILMMALFTACGGDSKKDDSTITFGTNAEFPPFEYVTAKGVIGEFDGIDMAIAKQIGEDNGMEAKIENMEFDSLLLALENGQVDAVIAGMTDTAERRQSIDFSNEYYVSELVLIVKKDSKYASATSLNDFSGAKIVSQTSTVTDDVIEDWKTQFNVTHLNALDTFATCAMAVQNGTADAMTAELPVANAIVRGSK